MHFSIGVCVRLCVHFGIDECVCVCVCVRIRSCVSVGVISITNRKLREIGIFVLGKELFFSSISRHYQSGDVFTVLKTIKK